MSAISCGLRNSCVTPAGRSSGVTVANDHVPCRSGAPQGVRTTVVAGAGAPPAVGRLWASMAGRNMPATANVRNPTGTRPETRIVPSGRVREPHRNNLSGQPESVYGAHPGPRNNLDCCGGASTKLRMCGAVPHWKHRLRGIIGSCACAPSRWCHGSSPVRSSRRGLPGPPTTGRSSAARPARVIRRREACRSSGANPERPVEGARAGRAGRRPSWRLAGSG